jgi:hypothetical protein
MQQFWDQPRIAREFGVAVNTVQSSWRNATIRALREHVEAHLAGLDGHDQRVGPEEWLATPLEQITGQRWRELRAEHGLRPLRLPDAALPLPDTILGTKPGWTPARIEAWADATKRRDAAGRLARSKPPGRPAGIVEAGPRRRP